MKNAQTLWDLVILLFLMCAGVSSVKFLAANNQDKFDYRFPDKSLIAGAPKLDNDGYTDPNLGVSTLRDHWDFYMTPEEVYGMMYIQDYTCPETKDGDMVINVAGSYYVLNNDYAANRKSYMRHVVDDIMITDLNTYPDTLYYLKWDYENRCWVVQYKEYEFNGTEWEAVR